MSIKDMLVVIVWIEIVTRWWICVM